MIVILTGTYVLVKAWQEKTELMDLEVKRSGELVGVMGTLQEKEHAVARMMERLIVQEEERRRGCRIRLFNSAR